MIKKWPFLAITNAIQGIFLYKFLKIERKEDKRGSGHALKVWYKAREELTRMTAFHMQKKTDVPSHGTSIGGLPTTTNMGSQQTVICIVTVLFIIPGVVTQTLLHYYSASSLESRLPQICE